MSNKTLDLIQCKERFFTFPNGDTYRGEFIVNLEKKQIYRHGIGTYFKLNGQTFSGRWDMDCLVGLAEIKFRNKCKYEGFLTPIPEFTTGTYKFEDGSELRGDFNKNLSEANDEIEFFDPNSKQWDHEVFKDKIILRYNWIKDKEEKPVCGEDDDSVSTPICLSDPDTEEEGC